jgi:NADH dehydrogenase
MREQKLVTLFGGAGFVGTQLVQVLARRGHRIRVAMRRPDLGGHVRPLGAVGQVMPVQANIRDPESVRRAVAGAEIVVNLVGIGYETGRQRFRAVHALGARNVAEAARAAGAATLVHMSALGADPQSESAYARSKAAGEAEVLAAFPEAAIIRPSLIFGADDGFFNRLGGMARMLPVIPLPGGGGARFQPVYVGDVADALALAAEGGARGGRVYELGGPQVESYRQLVERVLRETGRSNPMLPVPAGLMRAGAILSALSPFPPVITPDQVTLLGLDNVVSEAAIRDRRTLTGLGIAATPMDAVLPSYLWRFRRHGQFDRQTA